MDNELKQLHNQWDDYFRELPELECNYCGAVFKGEHECDYQKLKEENLRLKEENERLKRSEPK